MSHEAIQWGIHGAPTATTAEFAIVVALGEKAGPDGCGAFPSRSWLAERTKLDPKAVQRNLAELERRGVITSGDQRRAEYIRADRRPHVWDLPIPAAWYEPGRLAKINQDRVAGGLEPLTADNRPTLAPAPAKARRSDLGKPRMRPDEAPGSEPERGDSESPRQTSRGDSESPRDSPRGDSESRTGGLTVPHGGTESPPNLKEEPKTESLSRSDTSERPGEQRSTTRERDLSEVESNTHNADLTVKRIVAAWVAARGADGVPPLAPAEVARSAREMLAEGITEDVLHAAVAVMAPEKWTDFRKHLARWTPPSAPGRESSGIPGRTKDTCGWCDKYGWFESTSGIDTLCKHPDDPPAGHSAAQNRSAA